ncbi:MAG TPA: hypothetical protein DSN98_02420 [Thermoplasmata archaeon]|nr:MAG TPA: hypothetical protein DSN98_02420 [Thermoplasmata archaeon]
MQRSTIIIVSLLLLLIFPAISLPGSSQDVDIPFWDAAWSYRQELQSPIPTNDSSAQYQPIDLRITFEKPCWTENENNTSIRICSWYKEKWYELESQIYSLKKDTEKPSYITECNVIFLIPTFADGTERYFIYYNDGKTPKPTYLDHVSIDDENYSSSPLPEVSAQAKFYGIKEDGYCVYGVGQEGQLLDRSCSQVVVKQKKGTKVFDLIESDQIVSFAFSYYYGSKEKDESASDQVFIGKKIFVDGNLMVEFGIMSESKKKDVQTTAIYKYYYNPLDEKRLNVHVAHEMLKDATVQGIDNIDGRFGSIIAIKSRSASVDSLNFGQIYPYLDFYGENDKIDQYQLNQNPASKDREWIVSFKDDATLGKEAWLSYGEGKEGKANAVLFASNQGLVTSGTDERDGIQIKAAEKEYVNFLGTEVDYVSINFGRHSYKPGYSHDITIPSNLVVQFDAEVFASDTGGYTAVQKESHLYQTLVKSRQLSGDIPFEREQKRYNVTVIPRFGGAHLTYPWLSNRTGGAFPVMWIELTHEGRVIAEGPANRSLLLRAKKTFSDILEGEYLVKVYLKRGNTTKRFTGSTILHLDKDKKVKVFCTWERTIKFTFLDQYGQGIPGIHGWLTNKDGVLYDENITQNNGELLVKAPYDLKDPYTLRAEYKDFIIYDKELRQSITKLNEQVSIQLYNFSVIVTDSLDLPPGVELTPLLVTSISNRTIQLTPEASQQGHFTFEGVPAGDYNLQISYGDFIDDMHVTVPTAGNIIRMKFSAMFDLTLDLYDSKGNTLLDNNIEFVIVRDNQTLAKTKEKTLSLPPAQYTINAYLKDEHIGLKQVKLTNDKHLMFVTTVDSIFPLVLSLAFSVLFGFFVVLTLLKKFSFSSLLKCLAILLVILSFFQPWWLFIGSSTTPPAEKITAMYVNPATMIETRTYYGEISLNIAEMPDIFIMFLAAIVPLASLACLCLVLGILSKRMQKKNYALLLTIGGVILLGILLSSFYLGTTKLTETSIGAVQGERLLIIPIGSEEILMHSSWGFSIGFYLVCIAVIIAVSSLMLDIRIRIMQKKKLLSLRNQVQK